MSQLSSSKLDIAELSVLTHLVAPQKVVVLLVSFGRASPWMSKAIVLWSKLFSTVIWNACFFVFVFGLLLACIM